MPSIIEDERFDIDKLIAFVWVLAALFWGGIGFILYKIFID